MERIEAQNRGFQYRGLSVPDPAEVEDLLAAFPVIDRWIEEACSAGRKVFLHCRAGAYRSPTVAMAHMMSRGMTRDEAEATVKRAHGLTWTTGDVETLQRALYRWENLLKASPRKLSTQQL